MLLKVKIMFQKIINMFQKLQNNLIKIQNNLMKSSRRILGDSCWPVRKKAAPILERKEMERFFSLFQCNVFDQQGIVVNARYCSGGRLKEFRMTMNNQVVSFQQRFAFRLGQALHF